MIHRARNPLFCILRTVTASESVIGHVQDLGHQVLAQPEYLGEARAQQRPQIHQKGVGDVGAVVGDELGRHVARLGGDRLQRMEPILDRVEAGAVDRDRAVGVAPVGVLHGFLADLAGLALIDVRDAAKE